jgi:hypothetical protein
MTEGPTVSHHERDASLTRGFLFADLRGYTDFVERTATARRTGTLPNVIAAMARVEVTGRCTVVFLGGCAVQALVIVRRPTPASAPHAHQVGVAFAVETWTAEGSWAAVNIAARRGSQQ